MLAYIVLSLNKGAWMYLIAVFGLLMVGCSLVMMVSPPKWSEGIIGFAAHKYFHPAEIISRFLFGVTFLYYGQETLYPTFMQILGYLMVGVACLLLLIGEARHKNFAIWSAQKFKSTFRPAGAVSFCFGAFLIYAALGNIL